MNDRPHDRFVPAGRPAAAADLDRRKPLERLESRTLYSATAAGAAADAAEAFLIGGEVVAAPAAVHVTARSATPTLGTTGAARFVVVVGGDLLAARTTTFAVAIPPAAGVGGSGFRLFPNPNRAGQTVGGNARGDGAGDRRPGMPRPAPPVGQAMSTARPASDETTADADGSADARPAVDAAATDVTATDATPAAPATDAASARLGLAPATPVAAASAAAGAGEGAGPASADAADAALAAPAGPLPGAAALAAASAGPGPLTASAAAVAPAAAALAAAFASPAGTLRDALAALAGDVMPAALAGPFAAGAAFALLPTSAPSLARQFLGLGLGTDADGFGAYGLTPAPGNVPDAVVAGAGVALAAAGYWHSTAADRDRSSAAAPPARVRDGWTLTPFEAR